MLGAPVSSNRCTAFAIQLACKLVHAKVGFAGTFGVGPWLTACCCQDWALGGAWATGFWGFEERCEVEVSLLVA